MKPTNPTHQISMPEENKKSKTKGGRKAELEVRRLKIKEELEEIIEKTEGQNRALGKIMTGHKMKE
jgi:hypothetical protein